MNFDAASKNSFDGIWSPSMKDAAFQARITSGKKGAAIILTVGTFASGPNRRRAHRRPNLNMRPTQPACARPEPISSYRNSGRDHGHQWRFRVMPGPGRHRRRPGVGGRAPIAAPGGRRRGIRDPSQHFAAGPRLGYGGTLAGTSLAFRPAAGPGPGPLLSGRAPSQAGRLESYSVLFL